MSTVELNENTFFYLVEGTGIPCLVMHGGVGMDHHTLEGYTSAEVRQAYDVTHRLPDIDMPTLVLVGREDPVCSPAQAQILHEGIADSELLIFEQSGHFPNVEEPDLFVSKIREWFERNT